jgi:CHASE2 domain-containing sensor protein
MKPAATIHEPCLLGGRYRLEERLGEGALGVVWRARHLGLHRDFALKLLRAAPHDSSALARFQREAEALGRLRHPNVVEVTDFGVDPETGAPYLVMELLPGRTLADLLRETGPLSAARALPLLDALAGAIDAAHEQGILHRDLKPSNVALAVDAAGGPLLKVLDFGLAEISAPRTPDIPPQDDPAEGSAGDESLTSTGMLLGTPLYAAPEVIRGAEASRASDIYSLGVIAFEMLTGSPPFQGSTSTVLAGHLHESPPAPALPDNLCEALYEPLRKEPGLRPATAGTFVRRLRDAAERSAFSRWRRAELPRRAALAAGMAAASLAAALLFFPAGYPRGERWLDDLRMEVGPRRQPDPRILLVNMDESSLREGYVPLADRGDEVGKALWAIFAAGARGVAVDLILPAQWSDAPGFRDVVLHHPENLTLAAHSRPDGHVVGPECVAGLTAAALGPEQTAALFGFVNLDADDADGATRTGRLLFRDKEGGKHPSWAARAASMLGATPRLPAGSVFRIDYRIDGHGYAQLAWQDLAATLAHQPQLFRGRLVLVGILNAGDDYHPVPVRLGKIGAASGLTLQALQVDTIAAGLPVREAPRTLALVLAAFAAACAALSALLGRRPGRTVVVVLVLGALYAAVSFAIVLRFGLLLPMTAPGLVVTFGLATALLLRRRLTSIPSIGSFSA